MSKIIEVTVSPKGETSIQAKGFTGEACRDATRSLEAGLGVPTCEHLTADFHATEQAEETRSQRA